MRYVVIGAGAVGGVVAGRLEEAGHEVVVVARGRHGELIARDGLRLALPDGERRVRPAVAASVKELQPRKDDVLLVAVKSQQTEAVLTDLSTLTVDGAPVPTVLPVVLLQNGVSNEDAALRVFHCVHGVAVNLPATHLEPGLVAGEGAPVSGVLEIGLAPSGSDALDRRLAADLSAAGFVATVREDVLAWKRAKLLRNLGNVLDALCGSPDAEAERAAVRRMTEAMADEARAVFAAAGLAVTPDDEWDEHLRDRMRVVGYRGGGSTWQSLTRGQGSAETDHLNGEIVRLGRWTGVPTPVNGRLQAAMWSALAAGTPAGSLNAVELERGE